MLLPACRNGLRDLGEPGIPDITVSGGSEECAFPEVSTITDPHGLFTLSIPWCGELFRVGALTPEGWVDTSPNPLLLRSPRPQPPHVPRDPLNAEFGMVREEAPADEFLIEGTVFRDANRNGVRDGAEPGVAGVGVSASVCRILRLAYTDRAGRYRFVAAAAGGCASTGVQMNRPEALGHSTPNPVHIDPTLVPGTTLRIDFGVFLRGSRASD